MNIILRGVRVIDPVTGLDAVGQDVWLSDGRIIAIYKHIGEGTLPVVDLTPAPGAAPCILCPGFIDLHTHIREAGGSVNSATGTFASNTGAAAAGGFTHIVAMADTDPVIDTPALVVDAEARAAQSAVRVLTTAAMTVGQGGAELVDIVGCATAGAVAFGDADRNAASPRLLAQALREAGGVDRPVLLHCEDEEIIAQLNAEEGSVERSVDRPVRSETKAIDYGLRALTHAGGGRLHLQSISAIPSLEQLRRAREEGQAVTSAVTPHHLSMWYPFETELESPGLAKVKPPLRTAEDRLALIQGLREGLIDAVATAHSPRPVEDKLGDYSSAVPGMISLETALATCITLGGMGGDWIPALVERLTMGPYRVLGASSGLREPGLRIGESATCVLFDPAAEWVVDETSLRAPSRNTPLLGMTLRGRVLLTIIDGGVVHHDPVRLPGWTTEDRP